MTKRNDSEVGGDQEVFLLLRMNQIKEISSFCFGLFLTFVYLIGIQIQGIQQ